MNDYTYNEDYLEKVFETPNEVSAEWFGYYNYDVLSSDGTRMLCNRADFDGRSVTAQDTLELGYYDLKNGEWNHIAITDSFNWQQGAMLQWVPMHNDWVAYNFSDKVHFKSALQNILTGEKRILDFPIYGLTPDGKYSVSLHYERSYWCRAYHYQPVANDSYNVQVAEDDGIFLLDLWQNKVERIVSILDVINANPSPDFKGAKHWLEHIMISPNGKRFAFLHRYSYGTAYNTRLLIYDMDKKSIEAIPGWKNFEWSHFGWCGDDAFAIYTVKRTNMEASYAKTIQSKKSLKKTLISWAHKIAKHLLPREAIQKLKANASYYQFYKLSDGAFILKENFDIPLFGIDGHPSFALPDGEYMLTDSYPDPEKYQRLMAYCPKTGKAVLMGRFFAHYQGNPASCDLHPKLSRDNQYIAVDTAYSGIHKMILFRIRWDKIKEATL